MAAAQGAIDPGQIATVGVAAVSALAASASVLVARAALLRTRRAQGAQQLWAMIQEWESPTMKGRRRRVAQNLDREEPIFDDETMEVLNFFETVGVMVNRVRVIDAEACWTTFSDYLAGYVEACRPWIRQFQAADITSYAELVKLEGQMTAITAQQLGTFPPGPLMAPPASRATPMEPISHQDVKAIMRHEKTWLDDTLPLRTDTRVRFFSHPKRG